VYNAYPQAIHARDNDGRTPLGYAIGDTRTFVETRTRNNDGTSRDFEIYDDTRTFLEAQLEWERQAREETHRDDQGRLPIHRFPQSLYVHVGTIKLMISANPDSVTARDNTGCNPLHYACKFCQLDIVRFLLDSNEDYLKEANSSGELPLHIACREERWTVINCILEKSDHGVSTRNKDGKLPIELLLLCHDEVYRYSLIYIEAVNRLLRAHPNVLEGLAANHGNLNRDGI
jgi:hypothetical protein